MHVAQIHRYPVKSMLGESLDATHLGSGGIAGDRAWALRDEARGGITGAKRYPALMGMSARFVGEPGAGERSPEVRIDPGNGPALSSASADVDAALTALLKSPVSLWPLLPADQVAHFRRNPPQPGTDREAELRALFGRTADEALPDLSLLATVQPPPGSYFDAYPLLVMTRSSLDALARDAAAAGIAANFDVRRFRPNLLLAGAGEGFVENAWVGRQIHIGEAVLNIEMACPRCIMTTHGFLDIPREPKVMRALVRHNEGNLGVYASIATPGQIRLADPVRVL